MIRVLPKFPSRFSSALIKPPQAFGGACQADSKSSKKGQSTKNSCDTLTGEEGRALALPNTKAYYTAVVIRPLWCFLEQRWTARPMGQDRETDRPDTEVGV